MREEILGRDVTSVFPNKAKTNDAIDALKDAIGAKQFISETEVKGYGIQNACTPLVSL